MSYPDLINGAYECLGGGAIFISIRALYKTKKLTGYSPLTFAFFTSWGYWNLFYYPHLNQIASAIGASVTAVTNSVYLGMMWRYRNN